MELLVKKRVFVSCLSFSIWSVWYSHVSRLAFCNKLPFGKSVAPYRQNQTSMQVSSLPDSGSFLGKATVTVISKLRFYCWFIVQKVEQKPRRDYYCVNLSPYTFPEHQKHISNQYRIYVVVLYAEKSYHTI